MSGYRDSLPGDEARDRFDAAITQAGRLYWRALLDLAEQDEAAPEAA